MNHNNSHDGIPSGDTYAETVDPLLLAPAEAQGMVAGAPWRRLAVIGDSIAAGTGDSWPGYADLAWADRVAATLRSVTPDLAYINTGKIGATVAQVHAEQLVPALDFGADLICVSCGGNDLFTSRPDLQTLEDDLDHLCAALTSEGAQLSMFTLADAFTGRFRDFRSRFAAFAEIVRRVAGRHDAILTEFWDHPARLRPSWLSSDEIHLTMAGHAVVAAEVTRSLARQVR